MPRARVYPPGGQPQPPEGGILQLIQPDPYAWLYAIDVPSTPRTKLRLTAYPEKILFERDLIGAAIEYLPSSVSHEDVKTDTEGTIPQIQLSFQNVTRESVALLETHGGLIGEKVRVVLLRVADAPDGNPTIDEAYDILESAASETDVSLTLGRAAMTQKRFPDRRISRTYCAHDYGGPGCGYDTTRAGALQTCTKLLEGTNGCKAHGADELAAGVPVRHPQRMLFFPGVPRTSGVGVA